MVLTEDYGYPSPNCSVLTRSGYPSLTAWYWQKIVSTHHLTVWYWQKIWVPIF